ncbi:GDYXXLXY domain-containing protein [Flavobacterium sp. GCM10027622]|uniref:GDYXXLXY domain-containing protein n=1 Tax=unclassified Flavobacterium TaxID=196869 RepID=UPI003620DCCC
MKTKTLVLIAFFVMVFAQLAVPVQMVTHNNDVLETGKLYKFKTQPIDPYDPFRGKYINLSFEEDDLFIKKEIPTANAIYATLTTEKGFAKISKISNQKPKSGDYIKLNDVRMYKTVDQYQVLLNFPFDRFYMNEYKAPEAEKQYNQAVSAIQNNVYALVAVKDGEAIVKDVIINNISIKEYSKQKTKKEKPL